MIGRMRSVPSVPEALSVAGLCLTLAGLAIAADALARTSLPPRMGGIDRIVLGLWRLQLAELLTLTVGLGLLTLGLSRDALLGGWREPAARVGAGIAIGALVLAAAVVIASTYVALAGHVGSVQITGDSRLFVWLRQLATAAGFGGVWLLVAARLSAVQAVEPEMDEDDEPEPGTRVLPEPVVTRVEYTPPAPIPAPVRPAAVAVAPPAPPSPRPPETPSSAAARARALYGERLSFSPRASEAKKIVDEVVRLDGEGKHQDAERLVQRLQSM